MTYLTEDSNIFKATEGFCKRGLTYIRPTGYEGVSGVDKGFSTQFIENPDIPESFSSSMTDFEKGRIIDLDQALNEPPTEDKQDAEDLADSKAILDRKDEPSQPLDEVIQELDIDE